MLNSGSMLMATGGFTISLIEICLHIINFVILILVLKSFIFQPTIKFIKNRQKRAADLLEESKKLSEEAAQVKANAGSIVEDAKKKAELIALDAVKDAELKSKEILAEAKGKSFALMERAEKEIRLEKEQLQKEMQSEVSDLAVSVAEKILERELDEKDNRKLVEQCLQGWEEQ